VNRFFVERVVEGSEEVSVSEVWGWMGVIGVDIGCYCVEESKNLLIIMEGYGIWDWVVDCLLD